MRTTAPPAPDSEATELLKAANEASSVARSLYLTLLAATLFVAIVTGGLTDERLLRDGAVPLPLIEKTDLPLSSFYLIAPWLLVFVHAELLMHLAMLAEKLCGFRARAATVSPKRRASLVTQLASFPFSHWLANDASPAGLRMTQGLFVWLTVVLLPVVTLSFAQLEFPRFQDEIVTWSQRLSVLADVSLLCFFWPMIVAPSSTRTAWWISSLGRFMPTTKARHVSSGGAIRLVILSIGSVTLVTFVGLIPMERWETFLVFAAEKFGLQALVVPPKEKLHSFECFGLTGQFPNASYSPRDWRSLKQVADTNAFFVLPSTMRTLCPTALRFHGAGGRKSGFRRVLNLPEKTLVAATSGLESLSRLQSDADLQESDLASVAGMDLRGRTLRFAEFNRSRLYKADFRGADASGADASGAQLQQANLTLSNFSNVLFVEANLSRVSGQAGNFEQAVFASATLDGAVFDGANLNQASLSSAHGEATKMRDAKLHFVIMSRTRLPGIDLQGTSMIGARIFESDLSGARLSATFMTGSRIERTDLSGASFLSAIMQRIKFTGIELAAADLDKAKLEGSVFADTNVLAASFRDTDLRSAQFSNVTLDLNDIAGLVRGPWDASEIQRFVTAVHGWNVPPSMAGWKDGITSNIPPTDSGLTQGFDRCVGGKSALCAKGPKEQVRAIERAKVLGSFACSGPSASARGTALNVSQQYFARVGGAPGVPSTPAVRLVPQTTATALLADLLLDPKCQGHLGIPAEVLGTVRSESSKPMDFRPAGGR